jgi:hypothetical protein
MRPNALLRVSEAINNLCSAYVVFMKPLTSSEIHGSIILNLEKTDTAHH